MRNQSLMATLLAWTACGLCGLAAGIVIARSPAAAPPGWETEKPTSGPAVAVDGGFMTPYSATIPGTEAQFEMIPVPGGEFLMGSPPAEADRTDDEGPQVRVVVQPFWIGKCEVTWAEYKAYMAMYEAFKRLQQAKSHADQGADDADARLIATHAWDGRIEEHLDVDAVTSPTPLYDPSTTFMSGEEPNLPAVSMTQFAARQYTKWLSGLTGCDYRLPSEAEWEYAARAGSSTAYDFGDDPAALEEHAWFGDNGDYAAHPVGTKTPNAWGLHDMHGNAAEWTLDEFAAGRYATLAPGPVAAEDAILWPSKVFPRVLRGGSWLDEAARCRSAARQKSEEQQWKLSDPNRPYSPWWYTDEPAIGVGMRIIRPLAPMSAETKRRAWDVDHEYVQRDVTARLRDRRGIVGIVGPTLPAAVEAAKKISPPAEDPSPAQ